MNNIKIFLILLITYLVLPQSILALEGPVCKVYQSGQETIKEEQQEILEKNLKERVNNLNNKEGFQKYGYSYKLNLIETIKETNKTNETIIEEQKIFKTKEEAISYYNNLILQAPYEKGEYEINVVEISNTTTGENKQLVCKTLNCLEEIESVNKLLKENQQMKYEITIKEISNGEITTQEYQENNEIKYFDTKELAEKFAEGYIPSIPGYKFVKNDVLETKLLIEMQKTYKELKGNDIFETEQEATNSLEEFKKEYPNSNGKVEKIENGSKEETGTIKFDNKQDADNKILELTQDGIKTVLREETSKIEEEIINKEYETKEEAEQEVKKLQNEGFVVETNIEKITQGITGEVQSGISRPSKDRFEFSKDEVNFILLKQGSKIYAVWTEFELTEEEKTTFVKTYNQVNANDKFDGSTTNISKEDINWIFGFKAHDLTNVGKNWGIYTFTEEDNKIILTCNADKLSHLVEGFAIEKTKYILKGVKYKEEKTWYVDYTKTIYSNLYKITATAIVTETKTKYKVVSTLEKEIKEANLNYNIIITTIEENYKLNYSKYLPETVIKNVINWEIEQCEAPISQLVNGYPLPPQTGVNQSVHKFVEYIVTIAILAILIKSYKLIKD